jgi:protein phosphatase
MSKLAAKIQCVNDKCKTLNLNELQFCSQCQTPVIKRYLWGIGKNLENLPLGELVANRYLHCKPHIFLDTKPGIAPDFPEDIPPEISPYLKLFPYRIYLPQIYGYIPSQNPIWLLEYGHIPLDENGNLVNVSLLPRLDKVWSKTAPLRQLSWLWQILNLWQPLSTNKVVSSIFNPELLRVNGALIQILELRADDSANFSLEDLGKFYCFLASSCHEEIKEIVTKIGLCLQQGLLTESQQVLNILDEAIAEFANQNFKLNFQIITTTDPGKTREHNEDACYPTPEIRKNSSGGIDTLTIVCDGLGGQDGGEIASNLAIKHIPQYLIHSYRRLSQNYTPRDIVNFINDQAILNKLTEAISEANDQIWRQNQAENRQQRARMGTTVVMTLGLAHQMYIAHVGDSRVYWISENGCYQITVDDDLASREVRLGYAFYRDIIQYPQTGALLQALGMDDSQHLHAHTQRFLIDQDCIFLLCSDGLSDFDRVEQYWKSEILSLLQGKLTIDDVAQNLLRIGLEKNGHDNITIALVHCQVKPRNKTKNRNLSWSKIQEIIPDLPNPTTSVKEDKQVNVVNGDSLQQPSHSIVKSSKMGKIVFLLVIFLVSIALVVLLPQLLGKKEKNDAQQQQNRNQTSEDGSQEEESRTNINPSPPELRPPSQPPQPPQPRPPLPPPPRRQPLQ